MAATDTLYIDAKEWSKDENKQIHYSEWRKYPAQTIDLLKGFALTKEITTDQYGGDLSQTLPSTGFFRTEKIKDRWWVIDPLGHPMLVNAINSLRAGKSPDNINSLERKYGSEQNWISETVKMLKENGFNVAGSWVDTGLIIKYNQYGAASFPYTTQLNILAGFASMKKKADKSRKSNSVISFILDDEFASYCETFAVKLGGHKDDPNLLGHFSDNELPFTHTEFNELLNIPDHTDKCYLAVQGWMKEKGVNESSITKEQKEAFMGWLAGKYYAVVGSAIKKYDPNHLYIGSRLHSSAKNNESIFKAAAPFVDIISINYYGYWQPQTEHIQHWATWSNKPFFITEFYTKAEETGMSNMSGAGWIVHTQKDRGIHYQNFCLELLKAKNCVGWHWFKYQDNDPNDATADVSNKDSNKGLVNTQYEVYKDLSEMMKQINQQKYQLIRFFDQKK